MRTAPQQVATFYFQRDLMAPLQPQDIVNRLLAEWKSKLNLIQDKSKPNRWHDPSTGTILRHFTPVRPAANDTFVVQLTLNAIDQNQSATKAWSQDLWLRLQPALRGKDLLQGALGYTLTYQAVLIGQQNTYLNDLKLTKLLPDSDSRRLHFLSLDKLDTLAITDIAGGCVWLVEIPIQGDGLKAATVYVAVCPEEANDEFVAQALYGPNAALFIPDLIAHKSYHQIRQYKGYDKEVKYSQSVTAMRKNTIALLESNQQVSATDRFEPLVNDSSLLISDIARLVPLRNSLNKQLYNYRPYVEAVKDKAGLPQNDIFAYHHAHMQTGAEELRLKIEEGERVQRDTDTAVNIIRTRLEKAEQKHQKIKDHNIQLITIVVTLFAKRNGLYDATAV